MDEDWAFESTTVSLSSSKALKINLDLKLVSSMRAGVGWVGVRWLSQHHTHAGRDKLSTLAAVLSPLLVMAVLVWRPLRWHWHTLRFTPHLALVCSVDRMHACCCCCVACVYSIGPGWRACRPP